MKTFFPVIPVCLMAVVGCSISAADKAALDNHPGFVCTAPAKVLYAAGPEGGTWEWLGRDGKVQKREQFDVPATK